MIRFQAFGVAFKLPLLSLLGPLVCVRLGMVMNMPAMILGLSLHELAHIAAARLLGIRIEEIHLTPFGGSARMENPYGVGAVPLFVTSAAGPAVNLLCAVVFAALTQWQLISAAVSVSHISVNLILCFFNLLPALPLDGGRMLYCILQSLIGTAKALRTGIIIGRFFAGLLVFIALYGWLQSGRLNLCLILAAVFILVSAQDERSAMLDARAKRFAVHQNDRLSVRFFQLDAETSVLEAVRLLKSREAGWFILTKNGRPAGLLDSGSILAHISAGGSPHVSLDRLPVIKFTPDQARISSMRFSSSPVKSGASNERRFSSI